MKEYQCPICNHIGEFWGKRTCDKCNAVVIREPVTEGGSGDGCLQCGSLIVDLEDENEVDYNGKHGFMCAKCFCAE